MEKRSVSIIRNNGVVIVLQISIVILSVAVGYFGHRFILQYRGEFGLLREARDIIIDNSIIEVPDDQALEYGMIRGMLATLNDPYTYFVEPAAHEIQSDQLTGSYGGIGVQIERDTELNWRVFPLPDSPALAAGVQDGDILLSVEDLTVTSTMDEVTLTAAIRGPEGEDITISIERHGETLVFSIERKSIPLPSVTWHLLPDAPEIGLVQINLISGTTAEEIRNGIDDLRAQGAQSFILDLRNNGGGLVEAGIDIARLFLAEGDIIHRQFKDQKVVSFTVTEPGPFFDIPLVVLVNSNTASSAEIVAGALRSHQRAIFIGSPSFGKTTIQYVFELQDGSSVHITSGNWWVPDQPIPFDPDYVVTDDPTGTEIILKAISVLQAPRD